MNVNDLIQQVTDTVDQSNLCAVFRAGKTGLEVALVADEKGRWSIPGGHAQGTESHADACLREVNEETGLELEEVHPLVLLNHAARRKPVTMFYATVKPDAELTPGGGDVTQAIWVPVNKLGILNGSDRLAIALAARRIHNPDELIEQAASLAEEQGYAVMNVIAPPEAVPGIHVHLTGATAAPVAARLAEWAAEKQWPVKVIATSLCESSEDALQRAHQNRHLTPELESLLRTADILWRYESQVAPALKEGQIVIETGPALDTGSLVKRGLAPDLLECLVDRLPKPVIILDVWENLDTACLKEAIEDIKNSEDVDPASYVSALPSRKSYLQSLLYASAISKPQAVEYAIMCAEEVLPIWEEDQPNDHRPRAAIDAARQWLNSTTEENRVASLVDRFSVAADAAAAASPAARAAAYAAFNASDAAQLRDLARSRVAACFAEDRADEAIKKYHDPA